MTAPTTGPMAAVRGARRGRRDVTGARLIDPLTGPRTSTGYAHEATPIYDALIAEVGSPFGDVPPGPVAVAEPVTLPIPLRPATTQVLPAVEVVPFGAPVDEEVAS